MNKNTNFNDLSQEEKDKIISNIDRQIKINDAVDRICEKIDKDIEEKSKIESAIKMIDDKMFENVLNEKGPIFTNGLMFKYNKEYDWYETIKEIDGKKVTIHSCGLNDIKNVLDLATTYFKDIDITILKNYIVSEYYELNKDLEGISKEKFINNLSLISIQVDSKYVEYWFDDNNMYGGHNIIVSKKHDEEKITIDLAG